jgi:S-adenosylmethionine synthetase
MGKFKMAATMLEIQVSYKVSNYHPISMKFGTQTKTEMLSLKTIKAGM